MTALRASAGIVILIVLLCPVARASEAGVISRVQGLLNRGQSAEAEQVIQQELRASPRWEKGHLLLAQIYNQSGRYDLAERSAASAVHMRESVDGFLALATATMRLNRLNDSISWLEKAARLRPDYPETYKLLGMDYVLGGMLRESENAFRRATELGPENWEYHYLLGRTLFELGRIAEALPCFKRAVQLSGSSVKAWTALGQTQERLDPDGSAETSYRRAIDLCGSGPDCAWPLLQLGYMYTRRGAFREALEYFGRAVTSRPDWARPHFHVAKTLVELDDLEGARRELEAAVRLDDGKPEYYYQLAQVYRRLGENRKAGGALARFRSMARLGPKSTVAAELAQP